MATTLIINPGSTSKKYALYQDDQEVVSIQFEETSVGFNLCVLSKGNRGKCESVLVEEYANALQVTLNRLTTGGYISAFNEIEAVGVRVVAPGDRFAKHEIVDDDYIEALSKQEDFAPLHIPPVMEALKEVQELLPKVKLVAASDSAFHSSHPEYIKRYSLPKMDADTLGIKRYGYHGLSVASVTARLQSTFGTVPKRCLICHIGGGISVTALKDGVSFDSSMGYGPMSGLMMSGRAGDIDGSALLALMEGTGKTGVEIHQYLNDGSGFVGIAGVSDMREVLNLQNGKHDDAILAFQMFKYQFTKVVGGLMAGLGGIDALVFTATASVRNPWLRAALLSPLVPLGIKFDEAKNDSLINTEGRIEMQDSTSLIAVMKTDEFGEINRIVSQFL